MLKSLFKPSLNAQHVEVRIEWAYVGCNEWAYVECNEWACVYGYALRMLTLFGIPFLCIKNYVMNICNQFPSIIGCFHGVTFHIFNEFQF